MVREVADRLSRGIALSSVVLAGGDAGTPEEKLVEVVKEREFTIRCDFHGGTGSYWVWTSDISHESVKINADYHT